MTSLTESDVEAAALEWLAGLGWGIAHGSDIAPGAPGEERADYGAVVLERRLRDALARLNPELPLDALDDAFRKLTLPSGATLDARNRGFHRLLVDGVTVEYRTARGRDPRGAGARRRLRASRQQRLAGGQPVHRHRGPAQPPPRHRAVRQRAAPGRNRAEEPGRRGRHRRDGLAAAPDLQGRVAHALLDERVAHRLGRARGAHRHADRRPGVVQALAHGHRRGPRGGRRAGAAGHAGGRLRAAAPAPA